RGAAVAHAAPSSFAVEDLHMAPLDHDALDELLRREPSVSVSTATRREITRVSAGNPFFALELARAAAQRAPGTPEAVRLAVPRTLRELLGERIAGVPLDVRRALLLVAAASQPTVSLVETVLGSERASELLAAAVTANILDVERGRIRFAHPL